MFVLKSQFSLLVGGVVGLVVCVFVSPALAVVSQYGGAGSDGSVGLYYTQQAGEHYRAVVQGWAFHTSLQQIQDPTTKQTVGLITTIDQTATATSSAVLIGQNYLLTAAHTVRDSSANFGWFQYNIGGEIYRADQWWTPANYDVDDVLGGKDIAVVRLDRSVPLTGAHSVRAMAYAGTDAPDLRYDGSGKGAEFTMVGFGEDLLPANPAGGSIYAGVRHAANNRYDINNYGPGFADSDLTLNFDLDYDGQDATPEDPNVDYDLDLPVHDGGGEGMILFGDSGGPSLVGGTVVGIHSMLGAYQGRLAGIDTDVARFSSWIKALVKDHDASQDPNWPGYQTGLAGISIQDIIDDLAKGNNATLVPFLIENGYLNLSTMQGTSPFFGNFDYATGLPPGEVIENGLASGGTSPTFDPLAPGELQDAKAAIAAAGLDNLPYTSPEIAHDEALEAYQQWLKGTGQFGANGDGTINVGGMDMTVEDITNLNSYLHPDMFGIDGNPGFFSDYQLAQTVTPEPTSLALLSLGGLVLLFRRRRHHAAV